METDSQGSMHPETNEQHGGAAAKPSHTKPGGKKPTPTGSASRQETTTEGTAQAALEEEQRAAAQATVEDLQRRLAAVEAALAAERQKATEAQRRLAEQQHAAVTHTETSEQTTEQMPGGEAAFGLMPLAGFRGTDIFNVSRQVIEQAAKQSPLLLKHYTNFLLEMGRVVTGQSTVEPDAKDKRFRDEMWKTNPFYHAYLQTYLTWQQSLNAFINDADLEQKDADRARFVLSLFTEAVAPTNTLLGNPAAMKKMYETGGASLVRGLTHMLGDLANNGGLPSQVDMKAFQIGKDIVTTPGAVVFKNELLELIQYTPTTEQVSHRPLLFVPPQVNKFYSIDLAPEKSMLRYLISNGMQVFVISWRNPTPAQREWGFETYDQAILEAIDATRAITSSKDVNSRVNDGALRHEGNDRGGQAELPFEGSDRGSGNGARVRLAASQRPDLELLGQQLPDRQ